MFGFDGDTELALVSHLPPLMADQRLTLHYHKPPITFNGITK
jgi:hypothetical protein